MPLEPGRTLGPYEIIESAGAGGMGEVYKARDTRLDRTVAIKVLPEAIAGRPEVRERFDREARAISNLTHPHICALYDVGHQEGVDFIVMEYLEGETLAQRIDQGGALALPEILKVAGQIADALDTAHRQGFVHRDLKPGNIMLSRAGAKLLDFGLAKATASGAPGSGSGPALTAAPTATSPLTAEGTIVGTFQYMAPEQLEGAEADSRSDIFAFGAVLYEMATGHRAFEGKTQASLVASILKEEPRPLSALAPMTPPALDRVVRICLSKDPDDRWQTARDLAREIKWIAEAGSQAGVPAVVAGKRRSREATWMGLAAIFALSTLVLALVIGLGGSDGPVEHTAQIKASILPPEDHAFVSAGGGAGPPTISPDGTQIVFTAAQPGSTSQLWIRSLSEETARPLTGTEGASRPFWSPDGRFIGFFSGNKLRKIELLSGSTLTVADAPDGRGGSWASDGTIIYSPNFRGPIFRVNANGGETVAVTALEAELKEGTHRYPFFLPDERHFLYLSRRTVAGTPEDTGVWVGNLDSGDQKLIARTESNAIYAAGHLLFTRERTLLAQPFDLGSLELVGQPIVLADDLLVDPVFSLGAFSAARSGALLYQLGEFQDESKLIWVDREGKEVGVLEESGSFQSVGISNSGRKVSVSLTDPGPGRNIWIHDLDRGLRTRFTFASDAIDGLSQWSPDDRRIAYTSTVEGALTVLVKETSGAGKAETVVEWKGDAWPTDWHPDGKRLFFTALTRDATQATSDLMVADLEAGGEAQPYLATPFQEDSAKISPNGRWVAYMSNESGRNEIYLAPFPEPTGKWQVSTAGGASPDWRGDGRELYYLSPGNSIMAVEVDGSGEVPAVGREKVIFAGEVNSNTWRSYVPSPDGQRFLVVVQIKQTVLNPATLVLNWETALGD